MTKSIKLDKIINVNNLQKTKGDKVISSKLYDYSPAELQKIFDESFSYSDVLRKVGLSTRGSNSTTLKKIIKEYNLNINQMEYNKCHKKEYQMLNKRFGKLVVKEKAGVIKNNEILWLCDCDCGNQKIVYNNSLISGLTKSCGCIQKEYASKINKKDLTGQKFGKLLVLKETGERRNGYVVWECLCECGNIVYETTNILTMNRIKSCGCILHNSFGEEKIKQLLIENNIPFKTEKKFKTCCSEDKKSKYRFDFYVNNSYLIEYDGIQHFIKDTGFGKDLEDIQRRDNIKTQWAKDNNIPLIRIPYTHYEELCIEDLLLETSNYIVTN